MSDKPDSVWSWGSLDGPTSLELVAMNGPEVGVRAFDADRGVYITLVWSPRAAQQVAAVLHAIASGAVVKFS